MCFQPQPSKVWLHCSLLTHTQWLSNLINPKYTSIYLHSLPPNHNKSLLIPTNLKYNPFIWKKYLLTTIHQPNKTTHTGSPWKYPNSSLPIHEKFTQPHPLNIYLYSPIKMSAHLDPQNYWFQLIHCIPIVKNSGFFSLRNLAKVIF